MLHAGIALELSRLIVDDRKADANARHRVRSAQTSVGSRVHTGVSPEPDRSFEHAVPTRQRRDGLPTDASEDPWRAWRVVEPDAAYLRRRAA